MTNSNYMVALEIGSSKIKGAVGSVDATGTLTIHAIKEEKIAPNIVRHGCVLNLKEVSAALGSVINYLNAAIAPLKINAAYVSVGGRSLTGTSHRIDYALPGEQEVTTQMVSEMIGRAEALVPDRKVVEVVPGDFIVDKMTLTDPVGALGSNISTDVLVINCRPQLLRNMTTAITDKAGLRVLGALSRQISIGDMVLTSDERKLGVMLVDCGAETTTVSIYKGSLCYLNTLPIGARNITLDVAEAKKIIEEKAEDLKKSVGSAIVGENTHAPRFEHIDNAEIVKFVSARATEIVLNILEQVKYAGYADADIQRGIVLVGCGAKLKGFDELLSNISGMTTRQGAVPANVRCSGSKLNVFEDVDIVSLLSRLAKMGAQSCVEAPLAPQASPTEYVDPDDGNSDNLDDPFDNAVKTPRKASAWKRIWSGLRDVVNPKDDDDEGDDLDELN